MHDETQVIASTVWCPICWDKRTALLPGRLIVETIRDMHGRYNRTRVMPPGNHSMLCSTCWFAHGPDAKRVSQYLTGGRRPRTGVRRKLP